MINFASTEPFFNSDDLDEPVMAATKVGHDHIVPLIEQKTQLLMLHTRLHRFGLEDSLLHTQCLLNLNEVESDLFKAWAAPWN